MSLIVKDHDAVSSAKTTIISYLMVLIWELIFFGQIVQLVRAYKDLMNNGAKEFKFTLDTVYMFIIFLVGSFIALHCINGFFNGDVVEKYVVFYWLMVLAFILGSVVGLIGFTKLFLKSIKVL